METMDITTQTLPIMEVTTMHSHPALLLWFQGAKIAQPVQLGPAPNQCLQ